jgi:hypothetical protein
MRHGPTLPRLRTDALEKRRDRNGTAAMTTLEQRHRSHADAGDPAGTVQPPLIRPESSSAAAPSAWTLPRQTPS